MPRTLLQYVCKGCGHTYDCQRLPKTGYCRPCYRANPEAADPGLGARISLSVKKRLDDPVERRAHALRTRQGRIDRLANDADFRERERLKGQRLGALHLGHSRAAAGSPARRAQGAALTNSKLADIPPEYRDMHRDLAKRYGAAQSRAMIAEQIATDLRRFHQTGALQRAVAG